jgi:hemoglobin
MSSTEAPTTAARPPTPYELVGGEAMVRRIADRFYDIMDSAPEAARIRALHADDLSVVRERLFEFLSGWLGGPPLYFQRPDHKCIMSAHRPFAIGPAERDEWMMCMRRALEECGVPAEMRTLLDAAFLRLAEAFRNR